MKIIVVVSQSATANAQKRDYEEQLIADLLMAGDGCEVTVVPDVAELEPDTTGLLCLEGIKGDMILLSWHAPADAFECLNRLGIRGRIGKTTQTREMETLAPGVYDAMQRRIYCIQLQDGQPSHDLRREIKRIDAETQIKTVDLIGLAPAPTPASPASPSTTESSTTESETTESPTAAAATPSPTVSQPPSVPTPSVAETKDKEEEEADAEEAALDSLVDQLDELDL